MKWRHSGVSLCPRVCLLPLGQLFWFGGGKEELLLCFPIDQCFIFILEALVIVKCRMYEPFHWFCALTLHISLFDVISMDLCSFAGIFFGIYTHAQEK